MQPVERHDHENVFVPPKKTTPGYSVPNDEEDSNEVSHDDDESDEYDSEDEEEASEESHDDAA